MQPSMMIIVCLLVVTCKSDLSLIVHYNELSSWLVSLDNYHLDRFLQCLCLETSIECNLRLNTSSGNATGMEMKTRNQSETTSQFFSRYVCTFFYSNHSVVCKRPSREFYDNSTALFLLDSTSMCQLNCVEWSWTAQQTASIYKINNNNDITLKYNKTNLTCNSTTTLVTSITSTPVTTKTTVTSTMAENDSPVTTSGFTKQETILTKTTAHTSTIVQPTSTTTSLLITVGNDIQTPTTSYTVSDYLQQSTTTFPTNKHDINQEDDNANNATWIVIGLCICGTTILAIVVVAIVLCRRRCKPKRSRSKLDISNVGSNLKSVDNRSGNNDQGYINILNVVSYDTQTKQKSDKETAADEMYSYPTEIDISKTQPVGKDSTTYTETIHSYIELKQEPVEEQNASSLNENTSLPLYSLGTVVNKYPVINQVKSVGNEETAQTAQLYDHLGGKAGNEQNSYDYFSDVMIN